MVFRELYQNRDAFPRIARLPENDVTQTNEPRTAPAYLNSNTYHWLISERHSFPSVAEWIDGYWYCVNEVGPVTPEEMYRRGWRWCERIGLYNNKEDDPLVKDTQPQVWLGASSTSGNPNASNKYGMFGNSEPVTWSPTVNRPSWDDTWMEIVAAKAKRSTCARRAVGCVIVSADNKILATGYNGVQSDAPHCNAGHPCAGANALSGIALDDCEAVHAEQNALWMCSHPERMHTIYVTASPCYNCTKLLLNTPIARVVFAERYAHDEAAQKLWTRMEQRLNPDLPPTYPKYSRTWELYRRSTDGG
jgi:dCMP deaminase